MDGKNPALISNPLDIDDERHDAAGGRACSSDLRPPHPLRPGGAGAAVRGGYLSVWSAAGLPASLLVRLIPEQMGRLRDFAEITRDLTRRCSSMGVKDDDPDEPDRLDQGRRMTCRL
jgi:hypothetical protein